MWENFRNVIKTIWWNPEVLSSAAPLVMVIGILFLLTAGMIFVILRTFRVPSLGPETADENENKEPRLTFLNTGVRFRQWIGSLVLSIKKESKVSEQTEPSETREPGDDTSKADLSFLRLRLQKLEQENAALRALKSGAPVIGEHLGDRSRDFEEVEYKLSLANQEISSAHEQKQKALAKVSELEKQLNEVMRQVEGLYDQNAHALLQANEKMAQAEERSQDLEQQLQEFLRNLEELYRTGDVKKPRIIRSLVGISTDLTSQADQPTAAELDRYRALCETQNQDLEKMKSVLKVAKLQILTLTKRNHETTP